MELFRTYQTPEEPERRAADDDVCRECGETLIVDADGDEFCPECDQ